MSPIAAATGVLARIASVAVVLGVFAVPAPSVAQSGVEVRSDIPFATHGGIELLLDAYVPAGQGPFPAVVVIPGGKWVNIDKTKHADVPMYFAEHGVAAFAVNYRSALEFPYPAAVEDVTTAVRWVRGHAAEYDLDPSQLGAIGASSGGHLAALVGAMGAGPTDQGSRVSVVASWSGPMDLRPLVDSQDAELRQAVRQFLGCSESESCAELTREASPITYVDPTDPPMVLVNGDSEIIPVDQAEAMAQALTDAGVENEVSIVPGGHGAGYGGGNKILDRVIPYVQAWIEGRDAPSTAQGEGGESGTEEGKGQEGEAPQASPAPPSEEGSNALAASRDVRREGMSSLDVVVVAIAMVALVLAVVQQLAIVRLRRRVAALSGHGGSSETEAEGT